MGVSLTGYGLWRKEAICHRLHSFRLLSVFHLAQKVLHDHSALQMRPLRPQICQNRALTAANVHDEHALFGFRISRSVVGGFGREECRHDLLYAWAADFSACFHGNTEGRELIRLGVQPGEERFRTAGGVVEEGVLGIGWVAKTGAGQEGRQGKVVGKGDGPTVELSGLWST